MRALAISPHLDDAVFSCGGPLAELSDAGWAVTVATVFTGSVAHPAGFALACQLDKGLAPTVDYMALRRGEDLAACRSLGAAIRWLPFLEAPHRGYHSADALFGATLDGDDADLRMAASLDGLIDVLSPDLLLGPQAIGGHVDHVLTVRAMARLARRPTLWWRDFPYAARAASRAAPFADAMAALDERSVAVDVARKRRACAMYATQIGYQFGGEDGLERLRVEGDVRLP